MTFEDRVPGFGIGVFEGRHGGDAGVVDETVHGAPTGLHRLRQGLDLGGVRDIAGVPPGPVAKFLHRVFQHLAATRHQTDLRARFVQQPGGIEADPTRRACNDHSAISYFQHGSSIGT